VPAASTTQAETLYKNHLLESETYIGGKVEALESGVFRADLPTRFKCKAAAYQGLIDNLDRDLGYAIKHDGGWELGDAENYDEVKAAITEKLEALRDAPNRWGQNQSTSSTDSESAVLIIMHVSQIDHYAADSLWDAYL
jgi:DNA polymerase epsilon subunit 1